MKRLMMVAGGIMAASAVLLYFAYPFLEARYQREMDGIRQAHAHQIADAILDFAAKTGRLPFQQQAGDEPFMVLTRRAIASRSANCCTNVRTPAPRVSLDGGSDLQAAMRRGRLAEQLLHLVTVLSVGFIPNVSLL